jgi:hypothetical protein
MSNLGISLAMRAEIENTWSNLERTDWLRIEEKASQWLEADLTEKASLLPLSILSAALPEYIGFEESKVDHAVFEAALWVLGRPAFRAHWERRDTEAEACHFDNSIEDPLLTDLHVPDTGSGTQHKTTRLQRALAWGRSCNESMNATFDAKDAVLSEMEISVPKPPSSRLLSRPNTVRRRLSALRIHAEGASSVP